MTKNVSIGIAIFAFLTGLRAAHLWYRASQIQITPAWVKDGRIEPVAPGQSQVEWTNAIIQAANNSADMNRKAAIWTAVAVALSTMSGLLGAV
jgi:hypothetical protein